MMLVLPVWLWIALGVATIPIWVAAVLYRKTITEPAARQGLENGTTDLKLEQSCLRLVAMHEMVSPSELTVLSSVSLPGFVHAGKKNRRPAHLVLTARTLAISYHLGSLGSVASLQINRHDIIDGELGANGTATCGLAIQQGGRLLLTLQDHAQAEAVTRWAKASTS